MAQWVPMVWACPFQQEIIVTLNSPHSILRQVVHDSSIYCRQLENA